MNRLYALLIGLVFVSSCVRSHYYTFQVPEIGATLLLEENNSNTQRVFLCNEPDITDFDYLLSHSSELLINKNTSCALEVGVISLFAEGGRSFVFYNIQNELQVIPFNGFVLNEEIGKRMLDIQHHVVLTLPFDKHDPLRIAQDSTVMVETIFNRHPKEYGNRYLYELPSFFAKDRLAEKPYQIKIEPLKDGMGFEYCGIRVETDVPLRELGKVSFLIDPRLPKYLFNDCIIYRDKRTVRISGQDVVLVETDMALGSSGIRVVVNDRGVFIEKHE